LLGRIYDAYTNRTFTTDYSLSIFQNQELSKDSLEEDGSSSSAKSLLLKLEFFGNVAYDVYTGYFEVPDLK